jgi:hypothetical protein
MGVLDDAPDVLAFDCPRCHTPVEAPFYGPCRRCLGALRATYQAEAKAVEAAAYEPKMNVTPNAVALKDD